MEYVAKSFDDNIYCLACAEEYIEPGQRWDSSGVQIRSYYTFQLTTECCRECYASLVAPRKIKTVRCHSNPLTRDWSVTRLMSELSLSKARITYLLDMDQIYLDDFNQVLVREQRGPGCYFTFNAIVERS